jgi:hypothetical protein
MTNMGNLDDNLDDNPDDYEGLGLPDGFSLKDQFRTKIKFLWTISNLALY